MWIPDELYSQIKSVLPIPCVDLIVQKQKGEILLLKRKNEPAKGEWWFPGGRINFGESREDAAKRKLKEECGLDAKKVKELGTFDLILNRAEKSHAITTVFLVVAEAGSIKLDEQSSDYIWVHRSEKNKFYSNNFIRKILETL